MENYFYLFFEKNRKDKIYFTFIISFIIGLLTHMYYFTNNFPNHDTVLTGMYDTYEVFYISVGRWAHGYFNLIFSGAYLPWLNGLVGILALSLTIVLIIETFKINKKLNIIFISLSIITFKSIFITFSFIFLADVNMQAFLLSIFSIYILRKNNKYLLLSSFLLSVSIGIYQSYIIVSMVFVIIILIYDIHISKNNLRILFKDILKYIFLFVSAIVIYLLILKLFLLCYNINLSEFKGVNDFENYKLSNIFKNILNSYKLFFDILFTNKIYYNNILLIIINFFLLLIFLYYIITNKSNINRYNLLLSVFLITFLPISFGFTKILAPKASNSPMMMTHFSFYYVLIIIFIDKFSYVHQKKIIYIFLNLIFVIVFLFNVILVNIAYLNFQLQYEKSYNLMSEVMYRIREQDYYTKEKKIYIYGNLLDDKNNSRLSELKKFLKGLELAYDDISIYSHDIRAKKNFSSTFLGIDFEYPDIEQQEKILNSNEFKSMSIFPNKLGIKEINGIIVVKLQELEF